MDTSDPNNPVEKTSNGRDTECPFYGVRRMTEWLRKEGHKVNRKRVNRLMRQMGL
ncbi:MAG: transposase [wastewater metagenome]|nr:transposase [Candidatus Loosdrechtia aerotolerans]